jgi:methyltransferase family protein
LNRHQFLTQVHATYRPRNYLEVGVNTGKSLALSRVPTIAIDPAFRVTWEIACDLTLVKATSDDFFARPEPVGRFKEKAIDFAFIDGLHVFEFALRDFMNVEKNAAATSVVVFDDMLPRSVDEAARDQHTSLWAGDVYKVALVLARYRPDLICIPMNTQPTGVLLVLGLDPANTVLTDNYDVIVKEYATPDPQSVPAEILDRSHAVWPKKVLDARFWTKLIALRDRPAGKPRATPDEVRRMLSAAPALRRWTSAEAKPGGIRGLLARR